MKHTHFDALAPVCPACRQGFANGAPLKLVHNWKGTEDEVVEGVLRCTSAACQCEFPIIDSIPIIVPNPREFLAKNSVAFSMRDDLTPDSQQTLAECSGPGSWLDATLQHLSNYTWDHYAQFDPQEAPANPAPNPAPNLTPGAVARACAAARPRLNPAPGQPLIDLGCSVGRATFDLAASTTGLVLGIDTHIPMLRLAQSILRTSAVTYLRRNIGVLYDQRSFPITFANAHNVDFWACDATALPFPASTFSGALSLNVLDCVPSPLDHLRSMAHVLAPGSRAVLTTPYDWSANSTPIEAWIGGHSPRGYFNGQPAAVLRSLLTPGAHPASLDNLRLVSEVEHFPWHVRVHERSCMHYDLHMAVVEAGSLSR